MQGRARSEGRSLRGRVGSEARRIWPPVHSSEQMQVLFLNAVRLLRYRTLQAMANSKCKFQMFDTGSSCSVLYEPTLSSYTGVGSALAPP